MSYLERFLDFLHSLPDLLVYILLGLSAYVENVFPPIPGDTITAFGAFLVGIGRLSFLGVYLSTTLGSLLGFLSLFALGRTLGRHFFVHRDYRFFRAGDIVRVEQLVREVRLPPHRRESIPSGGPLGRLPGRGHGPPPSDPGDPPGPAELRPVEPVVDPGRILAGIQLADRGGQALHPHDAVQHGRAPADGAGGPFPGPEVEKEEGENGGSLKDRVHAGFGIRYSIRLPVPAALGI